MNAYTTIAIIGAGNLGTSIMKRLIEKDHQKIIATRRNADELQKLQALSPKLKLTTDNKKAVEEAGVVILATKETSFEDLGKDLKSIRSKKLLISLGPVLTLEKLSALFGDRNIRLITPVDFKDDVICYTADKSCSKEDDEVIQYIFGENIQKISEDAMPIATAYVLFRGILNSFFEPLCDIGTAAGFDEKLAKKMVGSMLISTGKEIQKGIKAAERLGKASGSFNEQSFTMKLHKQLEPVRKTLQDLFEKVCGDFKK